MVVAPDDASLMLPLPYMVADVVSYRDSRTGKHRPAVVSNVNMNVQPGEEPDLSVRFADDGTERETVGAKLMLLSRPNHNTVEGRGAAAEETPSNISVRSGVGLTPPGSERSISARKQPPPGGGGGQSSMEES